MAYLVEKMKPATIVTFSDVTGSPRVKMDLPSPLRIGDHVAMRFQLQRQNGGRSEVLDVMGDFRVSEVRFDTEGGVGRQHLVVQSLGKAPAWRAVKKAPVTAKRLSPARFPRTVIA